MTTKCSNLKLLSGILAVIAALSGCGDRVGPHAERAAVGHATGANADTGSPVVEPPSAAARATTAGMYPLESAAGVVAAPIPTTAGVLELGTISAVDELSLTTNCGVGECGVLDVLSVSTAPERTDSIVLDSIEQVPHQ